MDQIRKFGEQTSRILEFKPKGLEGQYLINQNNQNSNWKKVLGFRNMQENVEKIRLFVLHKCGHTDVAAAAIDTFLRRK